MSRPRFLADHNLDDAIVDGLLREEPSIRIVRARDLNLERATDPALLDYAATHGFVVVSHDVRTLIGFAADRIKAGEPMAGLVAIPKWLGIGRAVDGLLLIWVAGEAEEFQDRIEFLRL